MNGIAELRKVLSSTVDGYVKDIADPTIYRAVARPILYSNLDPTFELAEDDPGATLKKVYLHGVRTDGVVLKPDNFGVSFFKAGKWNKACDYLVLTEYLGKNYAIFLDLKSSLNDAPDLADPRLVINSREDEKKERQFKGANALFEYIKVVVKKATNSAALDSFEVKNWVLYEDVKSRNPTQATIMTTAQARKKSQDVYTMQVADAGTIQIRQLV